jgi:glyoxylase-like metal-dependent hydrolase (beta-lactamase superfamily II)
MTIFLENKLAPLILGLLLVLAVTGCSLEDQKPAEEGKSELVQPEKWWKALPRPVYAGLEKIPTGEAWFEVYKITADTYAIYEPYQFDEAISYLALGEEKATLIDTGTGLGNIKKVSRELTDLPVFVLNTHTHWDHIGGNHLFTDIMCFNHLECIGKMTNGVPNEKLRPSITGDSVWKSLPEGIDVETWAIPPVEPTALLEDGDVVDLGGRILEIIHTPGHSPGSICLLDKKNRILFTGDTYFPGPLYAHPEDVNIQDYMASMHKLASRIGECDFLCAGHNDPWVRSEVIPRVAQAFEDIMAGKGEFEEEKGLRRYFFDGFDILIRSDQILDNVK